MTISLVNFGDILRFGQNCKIQLDFGFREVTGSLTGSMARGVEAIRMKLYLYLKEVLGRPVDLLKGLLSRLGHGLHLEVL